ncbi:MAG: hypothetical protein ACUVV6_05885 [Thermoplasmatota archaeon]
MTVHADALLEALAPVGRNILDERARSSFVEEFQARMEALSSELTSRAPRDPHGRLAGMLRTASLDLRAEEFTTPRVMALRRCLTAFRASRVPEAEVRACHLALLETGLLGPGFSGGKRATVDGKY